MLERKEFIVFCLKQFIAEIFHTKSKRDRQHILIVCKNVFSHCAHLNDQLWS